MTFSRLLLRNLLYHRRGNLAVLLQDTKVPQVLSVLPNASFRVHPVGMGIDRDVKIKFNTGTQQHTLVAQRCAEDWVAPKRA